MKYIVFENSEAVIFSDTIGHDEVAGNKPVKSAGFCSIETFRNQFDDTRARVSVWGESTSLKKKSNPEDIYNISRIWF